MTQTAKAIFNRARKLPLETRADLVELLLNSIIEDEPFDRTKIDRAWAREAKSRFDAFLRGEIKAAPMEKVMKTLRKRHAS